MDISRPQVKNEINMGGGEIRRPFCGLVLKKRVCCDIMN